MNENKGKRKLMLGNNIELNYLDSIKQSDSTLYR